MVAAAGAAGQIDREPMPSSRRRLRAGAAVGVLLGLPALTACAVTLVPGTPSPAAGRVSEVPVEDFPIIGAGDGEVDVLARNALADLNTYWEDRFPATFGTGFTGLTGGYYSVDPGDADPARYPGGEVGCGEPPEAVVDNAFYCAPRAGLRNGDAIQYDRDFLRELAEGYGRFIPALVMAHEFGHAVQARVGDPIPASIAIETQADCFAGAWTSWVTAGDAPHTTLRTAELDDVLRGYLLLRDPVGSSINGREAHGSYFDRVSAFQQGFDEGPAACREAFGADRVYTQGAFSDADLLTGGDASYRQTEEFVATAIPAFWTAAFNRLGEEFRPPQVVAFSREAPGCGDEEPTGDLVFCAADGTVGYDETDFVRPLYKELGDYAVLTAVAVPYGLAARDQLGLSTDDGDAARSAVCLAGAFTGAVLGGAVPGIGISPGDADESVQFLLGYSDDPDVLGNVGLTGFQLVDVFRGGFVEGPAACGLGG
jgi:predicted metalloprotease